MATILVACVLLSLLCESTACLVILGNDIITLLKIHFGVKSAHSLCNSNNTWCLCLTISSKLLTSNYINYNSHGSLQQTVFGSNWALCTLASMPHYSGACMVFTSSGAGLVCSSHGSLECPFSNDNYKDKCPYNCPYNCQYVSSNSKKNHSKCH